jgi:hypothetical protein
VQKESGYGVETGRSGGSCDRTRLNSLAVCLLGTVYIPSPQLQEYLLHLETENCSFFFFFCFDVGNDKHCDFLILQFGFLNLKKQSQQWYFSIATSPQPSVADQKLPFSQCQLPTNPPPSPTAPQEPLPFAVQNHPPRLLPYDNQHPTPRPPKWPPQPLPLA